MSSRVVLKRLKVLCGVGLLHCTLYLGVLYKSVKKRGKTITNQKKLLQIKKKVYICGGIAKMLYGKKSYEITFTR